MKYQVSEIKIIVSYKVINLLNSLLVFMWQLYFYAYSNKRLISPRIYDYLADLSLDYGPVNKTTAGYL